VREELAKVNETRCTFTGTFVRVGTKSSFGHPKQTLLLADVKDSDGKIVTDHLWFNLTKGLAALCLNPGDTVSFDARVKEYLKGYRGHRDDVYDKPVKTDYKLSHPTKLKKL
jgi:hypothetical protein